MTLKELDRIELPASADMHVHLRQGAMMELVVPQIKKGGVDTVFVMPNLQPPITSVAQAQAYHEQLTSLDPSVRYLMSLYLHPSVTPATIRSAASLSAAASSSSSPSSGFRIAGVKLYPQGVTTNSEAGVSDLSLFDPVFAAMQDVDMVLNLHGEDARPPPPPSPGGAPGHGLSAEERFLPALADLHARFPRLRIVLEHCTTAAAVEAVERCGDTVAATITAHHLYLTAHDAETDPHAFCKPLPKTKEDRDALVKAVVGGSDKFFFGSDSAPHPLSAKTPSTNAATTAPPPPAGVFTQPYATQHVLAAVEEAVGRGVISAADVTRDGLEGFLSRRGRRFYRLPEQAAGRILLERAGGGRVEESVRSKDGQLEVGVSRAGSETWTLTWV